MTKIFTLMTLVVETFSFFNWFFFFVFLGISFKIINYGHVWFKKYKLKRFAPEVERKKTSEGSCVRNRIFDVDSDPVYIDKYNKANKSHVPCSYSMSGWLAWPSRLSSWLRLFLLFSHKIKFHIIFCFLLSIIDRDIFENLSNNKRVSERWLVEYCDSDPY